MVWKVKHTGFDTATSASFMKKAFFWLALASYAWLAVGLVVGL